MSMIRPIKLSPPQLVNQSAEATVNFCLDDNMTLLQVYGEILVLAALIKLISFIRTPME
jgi:hypothetical protein